MNLESLFASALPIDRIISKNAQKIYGGNTVGTETAILGAVKPVTVEEIQSIIEIANEQNLKLYPISTGKNWGYSDSMPITNNNIIVDLSMMNGVLDYNSDFSYVTVQPGVTQQQLADFLKENGDIHMVSSTGSSPNASIVGNYLERGYGIAPPIDHASAVTSLKAVLSDGSMYESVLAQKGCALIDKLYTHSLGAYTDGLFFQSGLGIVTEMTIKLARKPETACLIITDTGQESISEVINHLRHIRQKWDIPSLCIKVFNNLYVMAGSSIPYPTEYLDQNKTLPENIINTICKNNEILPYSIIITLSALKRVDALTANR